jgi:hypothetical protein
MSLGPHPWGEEAQGPGRPSSFTWPSLFYLPFAQSAKTAGAGAFICP